MRPTIAQLVRPSYRELDVYTSDRAPVAIDLSDNRNQLGPPPSAGAALAEDLIGISHYPSHYAGTLKARLADYLGVEADQIVTGCGSDDVLDSAIRAFAAPGDSIAFSGPTFAMIPHLAHANGLAPQPIGFRTDADWDIDAPALVACQAKITYLCSPNNPTGTLAQQASVEHVLARAPGLVIADEAYIEYGGTTLAQRAADHGRLLVVRTFSKAFGMAGLRIGYAVGAPELIREVEKSRGPYKVGVLSERLAVRALEQDQAWMQDGVREVLRAREEFVAFLEERGLRPLASHANFVLVPVSNAREVAGALLELGVLVRPFVGLPGLGDAVRISVGPRQLMERARPAFEQGLPCR